MKKRVLCTIPVDKTGALHYSVAIWAIRLTQEERHDVAICFPTGSPSENTRAHGMRQFLAGDFDYWLSIDSDNPPIQMLNGVERSPIDLVDLDLDLVGLPTPVYQEDSQGGPRLTWNVYERPKTTAKGYRWKEFKASELEECDAIGTGCFLVARRVIEGLTPFCKGRSAPFQRRWNHDGTEMLGSDLAFCQRVKAAGFRVWAHWGYLCDHHTWTNGIGLMQLMTMAKKGQ